MTDFFSKPKTKTEELKDFILSRITRDRWISTHETIEFCVKIHFADRGLRTAQELAAEGIFRRMTDFEKKALGIWSREGYWVANNFKIYESEKRAA